MNRTRFWGLAHSYEPDITDADFADDYGWARKMITKGVKGRYPHGKSYVDPRHLQVPRGKDIKPLTEMKV